jgi:hypothetical protein
MKNEDQAVKKDDAKLWDGMVGGWCRPRYEGGLPRVPEGSGVDYRQDFFDKAAYLTVSGQLQVQQ